MGWRLTLDSAASLENSDGPRINFQKERRNMIHPQPQRSVIKPSATARHLYSLMVRKAYETSLPFNSLHLSLESSISLSIELKNSGCDPDAPADITELLEEGWISAHSAGGWKLHRSMGRAQ